MNIQTDQSMLRRTLRAVSCVVLSLLPVMAQANQVNLNINLATPVMEAEQSHRAFIKVSLEGFKQQDKQARIPANVAIVLDKSGSMGGDKIQYAREAAIMAIKRLDERDIVSVVSYDSRVQVVVPATQVRHQQRIYQAIRHIQANGNTALFAGVSKGANELRKFLSRNKVNRVVLLSDGLANIGPQSASELGELGASLAKEGISVTTIGLGLGYNEDLMTRLAGFSDGNHAFVENAEDLASVFQYEFGDVLSVVAQGVNIEIHCHNGVKPIRLLGRESEIMGSRVTTRLNQLYSEQEKFVILEVEVPAQQAETELELVSVNVAYDNLFTQDEEQLSGQGIARFSASKQAVTAARDDKALEAVVEQVANEYSREAIEARDSGDVAGAKKILQDSASYLGSQAESLSSPRLQKQQEEALQDADALETEQDWNKQRKELKARQYKRATQQTY
ncbi:VWA domain-containing protein [Amphritea sp. 1_MG-2023]|uniref:vWA domain-containing protein n=1 Tax=Amphritea sp. 1_MG-2023 TaxID=3062670 RepID=UPI0026E3E0C3|nr:VWA domain-containing protein [Amphritea sp. 1_MG-2023]MDO6563414.1 VWA domain-containing protein [Amphritea sp. 1_MG-2023]